MCFFILWARLQASGAVIEIKPTDRPSVVSNNSRLWNDETGKSTLQQAQLQFGKPQISQWLNAEAPVHWLKFSVKQNYAAQDKLYLTIPFTDYISLYVSYDGGKTYQLQKSGDLVALTSRHVKNGQMVFMDIDVQQNQVAEILLRLQSSTSISQQFKPLAVNAVRIYTSAGYYKQFEKPRIYQALFYGALAIMMFYNIFLSISVASKSYSYYVLFLLLICVFLASNSGYIFELLMPSHPRADLYIRFLSTPLLLLSYLLFSEQYLHIRSNSKIAYKVWRVLALAFCLLPVFMLLGFWKLGRDISIILAIASFVFILAVAVLINRRGFVPARYFILADILLLIGGIIFALTRLNFVVYSPVTQYSVQIAVLLQVALLSLGLADRINLARRSLAAQVLENEKLKLRNEQEQKQIIEEKNKALQTVNTELSTFIYRTSHDIRGPLARLLGLCHVGLMDVKDVNALDYLDKIQFTAQTLDNILRRLKTMHEIAEIELQPQETDFSVMINEVVNELQPGDITVKVEVPGGLNFMHDNKLLKFILFNLLQNAFKFARPELISAKKAFTSIAIEASGEDIIMHVRDNGVGVSAEEAPYLFEMFSTVGKKYQDTGLGLYMVKKVLDKTGGQISLINDGGLTHFAVHLKPLRTGSHMVKSMEAKYEKVQ